MLGFFRRRRERKLLAEPLPDVWRQTLAQNVAQYHLLDSDEQARLRDALVLFIDRMYWEGGRDFDVTDAMKVTVAANACLLLLGRPGDRFRRARTIILYPDSYVMPHPRNMPGGVVEEGTTASGTAWFGGPVILSWRDVLSGSRRLGDGHNVVLHEFAHKLDMVDGLVDGTPALDDRPARERWRSVMSQAFENLRRDSAQGRPTLLRGYGATNPGEFFAVATETFFEQPIALREHLPEVYEVLRDFYQQDTAARFDRALARQSRGDS